MRRKKKRKGKKAVHNLHDASPVEVAKAFAGEVVLLSGELAERFDGELLPTGLKSLNRAIGLDGMPRGRIVEIFGPESAGKTALALHLIGQAQKNGGKGGIIDVEHALNIKHARQIGVDTDNLLISQPDGGEKAMSLALEMLRSAAVDVLVIDSVAMLQPLREQEKGVELQMPGGQALLMSRSMRFLRRAALRSNTLLIFINQIRYRIGVMFGNPETTPGGQALKYAADLRIDIRKDKGAVFRKKGRVIGQNVRVRIVKNKVGIPFNSCRLRLVYGKGWRSLKDAKDDDDE